MLATLLFMLLVGRPLTVPHTEEQAGGGGALVRFRRRGGQAGLDDEIENGRAVVRMGDQTQARDLGPATVEQLRTALNSIDFERLPDAPPADPTAGGPEPDTVEYTIGQGGRTIQVLGSALPAELEPLVQLLNVTMGPGTARP